MALIDRFRDTFGSLFSGRYMQVSWGVQEPAAVLGLSAAEVWRTQPYLRTVVTFMARNIAQLGLHTFERVDEQDRRRDRASTVAKLLRNPNPDITSYQLVYGLIADLALYDTAYWMIGKSSTQPSGWTIHRIPVPWVTARSGDVFGYGNYRVQTPGATGYIDVDAADMIVFHGWDPTSERDGTSPVQALKEILAEQIEASRYRNAVWRRGGRVSSVITRPAAHKWTDAHRKQFSDSWRSKYSGDGEDAGGTPILEDGMTLNKMDFSAHEQEFVEGAKLALTTVASVYHINPTMIGLLDAANFSNVREFRKMLYGDTLGPVIAMVEDQVNTLLLPKLGMVDERFYVEFNINEKLQGNFEEQSAAMQSSTGAPWMTRNEARSRQNLPAVDGGDQLVIPLNVLIGGQASPLDSGTQNETGTAGRSPGAKARGKGRAPTTHESKYGEVLATFFGRQGASVVSKIGSKSAPDWWDAERWDRELAAELYALSVQTSDTAAAAAMEALGLDPGDYDSDQTMAFLSATAATSAANINNQTRALVEKAIEDADDDESPVDAVTHVFDISATSRAAAIATTAVTTMSSFGTVEAGKQAGAATKTWVTGSNPRSAHAAIDGETVALSENFSNGLAWPGDSSGDADDLAGCNCELDLSL